MHLDIQSLSAALQPFLSAPRIYVAYSGGVDSHALLHLCARCPELRGKLFALHVHHGLQVEADAWLEHCAECAEALGIEFLSRHVNANPQPGQSPEETARDARYRAFAEVLQRGEVILSAQHRDDQMETLLLQLFRGAGLAGLAAMPKQTQCGKGMLLRPLLDVSRAEILAYAEAQDLRWVEDPSNAQHDYDRNYLRHAIVPMLKRRWPSVDKTVARAARHCASAQAFIDAAMAQCFEQACNRADNTLDIGYLRTLDRYRQQLLLRQWFKILGQKMPPETVVERISDEILNASDGHYPSLPWRGGAVRRYRNKLYWLPPATRIDSKAQFSWPRAEEFLALPGNGGLQRRISTQAGIDPELWNSAPVTVRYRQGGERLRLPGRDGSHELKKLFQEHGVAPWERERMPLIFIGEKLAALGGLWIAAEFYRSGHAGNIRIHWLRR